MARPSKYSPELRERAVRMVLDHAADCRDKFQELVVRRSRTRAVAASQRAAAIIASLLKCAPMCLPA